MIQEDAKSFLLTTPRAYDVIISEPSNPWMAGVAGVFSLEFYETCRSRLAFRPFTSQISCCACGCIVVWRI